MGDFDGARYGEGGVGRGEETILVAEGIQAANMRIHRVKSQGGHAFATGIRRAFCQHDV